MPEPTQQAEEGATAMDHWRAVAEKAGWDIDPGKVYAAAIEGVAWSLLDQTMDTADREPSGEQYADALATAVEMVGFRGFPPDVEVGGA